MRDLGGLESLEIADVFELKVFQGAVVVRVKAVPHRGQFVVRSDGEGVCKRCVARAAVADMLQVALACRSHAKLGRAHLAHLVAVQRRLDGGTVSHGAKFLAATAAHKVGVL